MGFRSDFFLCEGERVLNLLGCACVGGGGVLAVQIGVRDNARIHFHLPGRRVMQTTEKHPTPCRQCRCMIHVELNNVTCGSKARLLLKSLYLTISTTLTCLNLVVRGFVQPRRLVWLVVRKPPPPPPFFLFFGCDLPIYMCTVRSK